MKRLLVLFSMFVVCCFAWSPQQVEAHGWRWHSGCGSYYGGSTCSGYSYCSPQSYYPTYNYASPCYSNYGSYYGSSYYNGYGTNSNYSSIPYGAFPQYANSQYAYGPALGGFGGNSLLGLMGASSMGGANLTGSFLQPSYLSMPVGVGYGQSGYLQIPVGSPAGRASYLQIPVNTGYGPASYLQIELGRNPASTVPNTPTPGPTPQPLGSAPAVNLPTAGRFTNEIHLTASDELPPVVPQAPRGFENGIVAKSAAPSTATFPSAAVKHAVGNATTGQAKIQFASWTNSPVATQAAQSGTATSRPKDTSFSLVDPDTVDPNAAGPQLSELDRELVANEESAIISDRESTPWIAK
jgi:hypothetical protein